jgi:flagellar basal-body rod protein FlgB
MDLSSIPLFQAITRRMNWLSERQTVLAQNVANADTPGYEAEDLRPLGFRELVSGGGRRLPLATTTENQLAGTRPGGHYKSMFTPAAERTLSGNAVDLESEMMKVSETGTDYQLVTDLYKKHIGLIKAALGRSGG